MTKTTSHSEVESLERKRHRDRKAQNAMRSRAKEQVSNLQAQVAAYQKQEQYLIAELERLSKENVELRQFIASSGFDGNPAKEMLTPISVTEEDISSTPSGITSTIACSRTYSSFLTPDRRKEQLHMRLPHNTDTFACQTDKMLQHHITVRRGNVQLQNRHSQQQSSIHAILNQQESGICPQVDTTSLLISDILLRYKEIDTLPRRMATFYIMYNMTNVSFYFKRCETFKQLIDYRKWLIHQNKQTFDLLPPWLKPIPAQRQTAHPSWIDRVPWPNARAYLLVHTNISYDVLAAVYSSSFDISWKYDDSMVLVSDTVVDDNRAICGSESLTPIFKQHVRKLRHWTVDEKFARYFPELFDIVERDRNNEIWS